MAAQQSNGGLVYLWSPAIPEGVRQTIQCGDKPFSLAGEVEVITKVRVLCVWCV